MALFPSLLPSSLKTSNVHMLQTQFCWDAEKEKNCKSLPIEKETMAVLGLIHICHGTKVEEQMATLVWQVPRQMFAVARAAIYITVQHRHANICKKRTGGPFCSESKWSLSETDGIKHSGHGFIWNEKLYCSVEETGRSGSVEVQTFLFINNILRFASLELKLFFPHLGGRSIFSPQRHLNWTSSHPNSAAHAAKKVAEAEFSQVLLSKQGIFQLSSRPR